MTRQEIQATLKAMQIIMHLQGHVQDMAAKETGETCDMLKCAEESMSLAVRALNSAVVNELMDGGDQA